jgi:serine/threonine protein phosphatase PrpC
MSSAAAMCDTCGADLVDGAAFCERCGASTADPSGDQAAAVNLGTAAAVSERGRIHRRNEDAFRLEVLDHATVAVVCDGVSTSIAADRAARSAADAAAASLATALHGGTRDLVGAIGAAMAAAQSAVLELKAGEDPQLTDPASTLVCGVCRETSVVVGWVGDSRAYWLGADGIRQLTADNAWGSEQVAAGTMSAAEADADSRARSITRWVGADAPDDPPQVVAIEAAGPGLLILCSDGLWAYARRAEEVARIVRRLPEGASALAVARGLTDAAVERGGHDDITVAVIDLRSNERSRS